MSAGGGTLPTGAVFQGRYEIVQCISSGGMGAVYEVIHLETRRRRALKLMLPSIVSDPELRGRFRLEAQVTAEIESDHLVETFDAGVDNATGAPFLVMELLKGEDLGRLLERRGHLAPGEVVGVLAQVARALDKTLAAGIVHRDLKPENLFIARREDDSPRVKVVDFGIAKVVAQSARGKTTKALGTPLYMAPEQIMGGAIGPGTDLYAVGHIAFALLVGKPYFDLEAQRSESLYPVITQVARGAPEPATARAARLAGGRLPPGFDAWFARATALDPASRFTRAAELVATLSDVLGRPTPVVPHPAQVLDPALASTVQSSPNEAFVVSAAPTRMQAQGPMRSEPVARALTPAPDPLMETRAMALAVRATPAVPARPPPSAVAAASNATGSPTSLKPPTAGRGRAPVAIVVGLVAVALAVGGTFVFLRSRTGSSAFTAARATGHPPPGQPPPAPASASSAPPAAATASAQGSVEVVPAEDAEDAPAPAGSSTAHAPTAGRDRPAKKANDPGARTKPARSAAPARPPPPESGTTHAEPARRILMRAALPFLAATIVSLAARGVAAQAPARDPAAARTLFAEGRSLLDKGDWPGACAKFQASLELAPAVSPLLNVGQCHEHEGKLTRAWDDYQRALVLNRDTESKRRQQELDDFMRKAIAGLEARIPKLRVVVAAAPPGLHVERDHIEVPAAALGTPLPTDPGPHTIVASAPGYATRTVTITITEGKTLDVPLSLDASASAAAPVATAAPAAATAPLPPPASPAPSDGAPASRRWPWYVGAGGVALLAGGVAMGGYAQGGASWIQQFCPGSPPTCDPHKVTAADVSSHNAQKDVGLGASIALSSAGVIALGAAAVGLVTAPARPTQTGRDATRWLGGTW